MRLAELQIAMSGYLTDAPDNRFAAMMHQSPGLDVYRNNYRGQLRDCLRDVYEKCWSWLGDDAFDLATETHIDQHRPSSWTLDRYGPDFNLTLQTLYPDDAEVAELAWLEWAMRRAFDGPDSPLLDPATLGEVDWERARFTLIPTLNLGSITTNAAAIWSALAEDTTPPPAASLPEAATIFVWRHDLTPRFRTVDAGEKGLMRQALAGASFSALCASLAAELTESEAAAVAGAVLGQWLRDGLIAGLY